MVLQAGALPTDGEEPRPGVRAVVPGGEDAPRGYRAGACSGLQLPVQLLTGSAG